ncbi:MAG: hypothetical protein EON98_02995, partial [Chitinophagaceae bacterium]
MAKQRHERKRRELKPLVKRCCNSTVFFSGKIKPSPIRLLLRKHKSGMKEFNASTAQLEEIEEIGKGHPKQLYMLFFAEMWERFSFYGMKALLLAYMVTQLKFDEPKGYAILGSYAALVYTMPMFGGIMADRFLGYRRSVLYGGILMSIGHLVLAVPQDWSFFYGMAFIICGNGFFNYVGERINWHYGFGLAGIFMIVGLVVFAIGQKSLGAKGMAPSMEVLNRKLGGILKTEYAIYGGTLLIIPVIVALFNQYHLMDYIMFGLGTVSLIFILYTASKLEREAKYKLFAALVMIVFSTLFWAFYEQNAGSLNLFAMRNVNM